MWFEVDKEGLGKLLERRGKGWAISELASNAWDEKRTTKVSIDLNPIPGRSFCTLSVLDNNPTGFLDLSHAYTLFAESYKKSNEKQRGRFNLGEKLVLALCESATISSTTGTIVFDDKGRHNYPRRKRDAGTLFEAVIRMTREEYAEVCADIRKLIPPSSIETTFNGVPIPNRTPLLSAEASLMTEVANEQGVLKRVRRETKIYIYEPLEGEVGYVYEMGIPVAETGDKYLVDVQQKVPLNMERDALPENFLRELRAIVLNKSSYLLTPEEASATWVADALEDDKVAPEAVKTTMDLRFGAKRVIFDPSDPEANALAVTKGYAVVHGGTLSKRQWENVKAAGAMLPAGQVTPSPKPFSPEGKPLKTLAESEYGPEHRGMVAFAEWAAMVTIGRSIRVVFANDPHWKFGGAFGPTGPLYINALDSRFSGQVNPESFIDFLIHEFGHDTAENHLSDKYFKALTLIGAKMALAMRADTESLELLRGE